MTRFILIIMYLLSQLAPQRAFNFHITTFPKGRFLKSYQSHLRNIKMWQSVEDNEHSMVKQHDTSKVIKSKKIDKLKSKKEEMVVNKDRLENETLNSKTKMKTKFKKEKDAVKAQAKKLFLEEKLASKMLAAKLKKENKIKALKIKEERAEKIKKQVEENIPKKRGVDRELARIENLVKMIDISQEMFGDETKPRLVIMMIVRTNYSSEEDLYEIDQLKKRIAELYGEGRMKYQEEVLTEAHVIQNETRDETRLASMAGPPEPPPEPDDPYKYWAKPEYGSPEVAMDDKYMDMQSQSYDREFEDTPDHPDVVKMDWRDVDGRAKMPQKEPVIFRQHLEPISPIRFDPSLLEIWIETLGYPRTLFRRRYNIDFKWSEADKRYAMESIADLMNDQFHLGFDMNRSQKDVDRARLFKENPGLYDESMGTLNSELEGEDDDFMDT